MERFQNRNWNEIRHKDTPPLTAENGKTFVKLEVAKEYEPKLYIAANNVFGKSYDYTRKYKEFRKNHV